MHSCSYSHMQTIQAENRERIENYFGSVTLRAIDSALPKFKFPPDGGRMLNESDTLRNTVVLHSGQRTKPADLGLGVGDVLAFQVLDRSDHEVGVPVEFEIIGISEVDPIDVELFGRISMAQDPFAELGLPSLMDVGVVQVGDADRDVLVRALNQELEVGLRNQRNLQPPVWALISYVVGLQAISNSNSREE